MAMIKLAEIFYSIQGETSSVGKPAVFIRLAGCNLKCSWCDTVYARQGGYDKNLAQILHVVKSYRCPLVIVTGGEPLIQKNTSLLLQKLVSGGFEVLLETNGSLTIKKLPEDVRVVLDIKTPSSGESGKMDLSNLKNLRSTDELKFVIANKNDFIWSRDMLKDRSVHIKEVLFSPLAGRIGFKRLAEWVMKEIPGARVQPNLHKKFSLR